uniref:EGF like repeats and discoidin domains 3 n=1 Tax=Eptatretus burgeri TaxID=7764 RepID=A0A8C4NGL3_EPTBU
MLRTLGLLQLLHLLSGILSIERIQGTDQYPDICQPNPCANGGTCEGVIGTKETQTFAFRCLCPDGSSGPNCTATDYDLCVPNPCYHGGVCEKVLPRGDSYTDFHCTCQRGYRGHHCQIDINDCESTPCLNGGVCTDFVGDYQCHCTAEFLGRNCQLGCASPLGLESGLIRNNRFSASSFHSAVFGLQRWFAHNGRLNNRGMVNAWTPDDWDYMPWIQVNLGRKMRLSGIVTQGAKHFGRHQYVHTFTLAHSNNGKEWTFYNDSSTGQDKVFLANKDNNSPQRNLLQPAIKASYIRVFPQTCRKRCSLRLELLGCELTGCSEPLGMKSGKILDAQITASSSRLSFGLHCWTWKPSLARLDKYGRVNAWVAGHNNHHQWLQVDLLRPRKVTGVVIQGARDFGKAQFVRAFRVSYSDDGSHWLLHSDDHTKRPKLFKGNFDNNSHVRNMFNPPFIARYIRLLPEAWHRRITLRVELLGCDF